MVNATEIPNDFRGFHCALYRAWLAKHVYGGAQGGSPYANYMAQIDSEWDILQEVAGLSGLKARLYEPKDKGEGGCDPAMVFKGTVMEDLRGIAIFGSLTLSLNPMPAFGGATAIKLPDMQIGYIPEANANQSAFLSGADVEAKLKEKGYEPARVLSSEGQAASSTWDQHFLGAVIRGGIYLNQNGDWDNNFRQAFGMPASQYQEAIKLAPTWLKIIMNKNAELKAKGLREKILYSVGHSLGGGLASAVSTTLAQYYPKEYVRTDTFNASGVHPNTVAPASIGMATVNNFTVKDEILTTIQSNLKSLPFVGPILRILSVTPPASIGSPSQTEAKGQLKIPGNLFPIDRKKFPYLTKLNDALDSAQSASGFAMQVGAIFAEELAGQTVQVGKEVLSDPLDAHRGSFWRIYDQFNKEAADMKDIISNSINRHLMDVVIPTYEHAATMPLL